MARGPMAWPSSRESGPREQRASARHALVDLSARTMLPELRSLPVTDLPGVGPRITAALKDLNVGSVADLVSHYPSRHEDLSNVKKIADLRVGETVSYTHLTLPTKRIV